MMSSLKENNEGVENMLNRNQERLVVIVAAIGMFLSTLDTGIINVALPFFRSYFHTSPNTVALTVIGYTTSLAIFIMLFGILSDQKGKLKIALWGMIIFMGASLLCGISTQISEIIVFRIVQGIGAAALQATSASLITTLIRPQNQNKAIGTIGIMIGLGPVLGPSLGGLLLSLGSWRLIFLINIPFTLIGIICEGLLLRNVSEQLYDKQIDYQGFVLNALMISGLLVGLNQLEKNDTRNLGLMFIGAAVVIAFILYNVEKHKNDAIIDIKILKNSKTLILLLQTMLFGFASAVIFLLPPFFFENILHVSTGMTGLLVLGAPVGIAIFSKVAGNLNDGTKNVKFSLIGIFLMLLSFVGLAMIPPKLSPLWITGLLFLYGVGGRFFQPSNVAALMGAVGLAEQGKMSALQRMTQNVAIALGSSIGSIIMYEFGKNEYWGIKTGYLVTLILIGVTLLISFIKRKKL